MGNHSNLIYALKDGVITSISDVPSGLKCGCVCPACGAALVARKGTKNMHHFAHYAGENCEYGYETSLHMAAKEVLSRSKRIVIPAVYVDFPQSGKARALVSQEKEIEIDHVELEKSFGDVIPDVVVYSGGKKFFVEIFVTHAIDEEKLARLKAQNISTIEIDLSKEERGISEEDLSKLLLESNAKKEWKYNAVANRYYHCFLDASDKMRITARGMALHVDGCPLQMRIWKGKAYANFIDECTGCEYCVFYSDGSYVLCSGRRRISKVSDFFKKQD